MRHGEEAQEVRSRLLPHPHATEPCPALELFIVRESSLLHQRPTQARPFKNPLQNSSSKCPDEPSNLSIGMNTRR